MKNVRLLYEYEDINRALLYNYKIHTWVWDAKFCLVGDEWRVGLDGPVCSLESEVNHLRDVTDEYIATIEQHEKENKRWVAFQNCKKKTCICKRCDKFCNCGQCVEKKSNCVLND